MVWPYDPGSLSSATQQRVKPGGGMVGDAGKHIGEPSLRIDVPEFGRGDQRVDQGGGALATAVRISKRPQPATEGNMA
jgi:hypothetical protein